MIAGDSSRVEHTRKVRYRHVRFRMVFVASLFTVGVLYFSNVCNTARFRLNPLDFWSPPKAYAATTYTIGGQVTNSGQTQPQGKNGFLITLSGPASRSALTGGSGGSYFFSGLPKGQYIVHIIIPAGYQTCGPVTVMTSLGPSKIVNFCVTLSKAPPPPPPSGTATCNGFSLSVATPNPAYGFKAFVRVKFSSPSDASGDFGPDSTTVSLTGPPPFSGVSSTTKTPSISGDTVSATLDIPATKVAGVFSLSWKITGSQAPTVSCSDSITIAHTPYFTMTGGDISAGQGFGAGCSANPSANITGRNLDNGGASPNYFGAGSTNGAVATGSIDQFATDMQNDVTTNLGGSADGLSTNRPKGLSFANDHPSGTAYGGGFLGASSVAWCMPDYAGEALGTSGTSLPNFNTLAPSNAWYVYRLSGDQTLGTIHLKPGVRVTLIVTGNVYIGGNITYDAYSALADIPQFSIMVVGGDMYVGNNVNELHGFYDAQPNASGANGKIFTCATSIGTDSDDYATCRTRLAIYGSVAAEKIIPGRTLGDIWKSAAPLSDVPAEQFVYTPELWLGDITRPYSSCANDPTQAGCMYQAFTDLPPVL